MNKDPKDPAAAAAHVLLEEAATKAYNILGEAADVAEKELKISNRNQTNWVKNNVFNLFNLLIILITFTYGYGNLSAKVESHSAKITILESKNDQLNTLVLISTQNTSNIEAL